MMDIYTKAWQKYVNSLAESYPKYRHGYPPKQQQKLLSNYQFLTSRAVIQQFPADMLETSGGKFPQYYTGVIWSPSVSTIC